MGTFNCRVSVVSTSCECKLSRNFITMLEIFAIFLLLPRKHLCGPPNVIIYVYTFAVSWRYGKISRFKKTTVCHWNLNAHIPAHNFSKRTQVYMSKRIFESAYFNV